MLLKVLGSSSSGNCYLLFNENECLIIEAGIKFKEVQKALNFEISKIVGCIITHEHGDHCGRIEEYMKAAIPVYCSQGTSDQFKFKGIKRPDVISHGKQFTLGGFTIKPFEIQHDAAQPMGFLISHSQTGKILFLTDTFYSDYIFSGLSHILVETNFSDEILSENIASGTISRSQKKRLLTSHMSLKTAKELLSANDLSKTVNIVLIHLSSRNADPVLFKSEIEKHTGKIVNVASKGLTLTFNKEGF